jgi:hypothetical protein
MKAATRQAKWLVLVAVCCVAGMLAPGRALSGDLLVDEVYGNHPYHFWWGVLVKDKVTVGVGSEGTLIHRLGFHTVGQTLTLGEQAGSHGQYLIPKLSLGMLWAKNEVIGDEGRGDFEQKSGLHWVKGNLTLACESGSIGNYLLQDGKLSVGGNEHIGPLGVGTFTQKGGLHEVNHLVLGDSGGGTGTYNYEGGQLKAETLEVKEHGTFNINGGDATIYGDVTVYNGGTVKTTNSTVVWDKPVTVEFGGSFISDPCVNVFRDDLTVRGTLRGCEDDVFCFSQDVTLEGEVELADSRIEFLPGEGVTEHCLILPAERLAVDSLYIAAGERVLLKNDGILYARDLEGLDIDYDQGVIRNIVVSEEATDVRLIYDINDNPELEGQIFSLAGGDSNVIPTPLPGSVLLLGTGLLGLCLLGWRRKQ